MSSTSAVPADYPPDVDLRMQYAAGIITMTVVAVLIAWLRMYVRVFMIKKPGWDDWVMFVTTVRGIIEHYGIQILTEIKFLTIVTNAFLIEAYYLGLGRHIVYVPPAQIPDTFRYLWMAEPTNLFALFAVRLSISLSFFRIVPKSRTVFRGIIWATIISLALSDVYVTIIYFVECIPIQKIWMPDTPGWCISNAAYQAGPWVYQAVSISVDCTIVGLAVTLFWGLQIPLRTKIALVCLTCLGIFTCICSIVKTVLLQNLFASDPDKTWTLAQLCLWAPLEICVGMVCGCLPCLKPLFDKGFKGSTTRGTRIYGQTTSIEETNDWRASFHKSNVDKKARTQSMRLDSDTSLYALKDHPKHNGDIQKTTVIEWSSASSKGVKNSEPGFEFDHHETS